MVTVSDSELAVLSTSQKLQLIERLWDSIPEESQEMDVLEKERAFIDQRLEDYARNPDPASYDLDEVFNRIRREAGQ